jgi:CheY-like chemotaxis protein
VVFATEIRILACEMSQVLEQGLVLVADDDLDARAAAAELLVDLDYWPVTARNGLEALELIRRGVRPTAMLIDAYMPLMDGEAFCRECDRDCNWVSIPRVLISGRPDAERRTAACGARAFLGKPIDPEEVFGLLGSLSVTPEQRRAKSQEPV